METKSPYSPRQWNWKNIFQYFLQGMIIVAPITITLWTVFSLFFYIDNILPSILHKIAPGLFKMDESESYWLFPGFGFILVIFLIIIVGWISSSYLVGKLVEVLGHVLERTPGIKIIYTSIKDFLEAFAGDKRKFDKPVLVNVDGADVWRMGFMTQPDCSSFGLTNHVVVYLPHSYALSGIVYMVPIEKIKILTNVPSTEAMKFAVSGGVAEINNH